MSILSKLIKLMAASLAGHLKIEPFAEARRTLKTGPARKAFLKKAASNRVDTYWQVSYNLHDHTHNTGRIIPLEPQSIACPSCGATHDIYNPGVITVVCDYCGNAIYWDAGKIENAGRQSVLPEGFTRLFRGATGRLENRAFVVMGRVRYSFGRGFWDEWFLEFSDRTIGWLTEDNHELALQTRTTSNKIPPLEALTPGKKFTVRKIDFIVQAVGEAECIGVEGDLPIEVQTGETYRFVDAASPDGKYTFGIEYDATPPTLFVGKWVNYASITLNDEGLDW